MDKTTSKRKTAMVLYCIEESLGRFISKNENSIRQHSAYDSVNINDLIERSYLDEIYNLAINVTKDTPEEDAVKWLYKLSHDLNIYEIRNAIAHPNRIFLDVYWYRIAAIAADPAFEMIGVSDVRKCLFSAESGIINDPPEGWERKFNWEVPNNLPNKFESDITGLIGRNKELLDLKDKISSQRIASLAIVAPGGFGKTALALDLLKQIVTTSESTKWLDAVCYVTLKTEAWDNGNFVKLDSLSEITAIEMAVAEQLGVIFEQHIYNLEQAISEFSNKRIVICIDNLETILRDNDYLFNSFTEKLPRDWKILVTSRVVITNAFIYTLSELKETAAIHLSRIYNRNKGGDDLPQERYQTIAKDCHYNPLAIKMTLDLYIAGKEIPASISEAKSNIAYFSFSNLIDSLTDNALSILELVFIDSSTNRKLICEVLELNVDDAATAINELSRTSLINRVSLKDKEAYEINGSIVELMITSPKCLSIRTKIHDVLNKRKIITNEIEKNQKTSGVSEWHFQYIPSSLDDGLKLLMSDFAKIGFKHDQNKSRITDVYLKFKQSEEHYKNNYIFLRSFARIHQSLQLHADAERYYKCALEFTDDNVTRYMLARLHFEQHDYLAASEEYKVIVDSIKDERVDYSNEQFHNTIYQGFFLSNLYSQQFEVVLDFTKKWKEHSEFRSLFGTYRASAYKRKIESIPRGEYQEIFSCLNSATKILDDVYRTDGYSHASSVQGIKIIEEISYQLNAENVYNKFEKETTEFLAFCDKHLMGIAELVKHKDIKDIASIVSVFNDVNVRNNPFVMKNQWRQMAATTDGLMYSVDQIKDDHVLASIVRVPVGKQSGRPAFFFAAKGEQEYFVHLSSVENYDPISWQRLRVGAKVAITDAVDVLGKSAKEVRTCYLINI